MRVYFTLPDPFPFIFSSFILILSSLVLSVSSSLTKSSSILSICSDSVFPLFPFSVIFFPFFIPLVLSSPSQTYQDSELDCSLPCLDANCSNVIQDCEYCNISSECSLGTCHIQNYLGSHAGVCRLSLDLGPSSKKDEDGLFTLFSTLPVIIFIIIIFCICSRVFSSLCSWRKCCECQCVFAVHCCCEPKIPSLRVIPATGDQRHNPESLNPTPPPSYLELFPEANNSVEPQVYPPFTLEPDLDIPVNREPAVLTPATINFASRDENAMLASSLRLDSSMRAQNSGSFNRRSEDDFPSWNSVASVASFPMQSSNGSNLAQNFDAINADVVHQADRVLTVTRNPRRNQIRPTTC